MLWFVSFFTALALAGFGAVFALFKKHLPFGKSWNTTFILGSAVFLACVSLTFPVFLQTDAPGYAVLKAASHSIRMFVVDTAVSDITDELCAISSPILYTCYKIFVCVMYLAGPVFTLGVVAEYFGEIREILYIRFFQGRKKYVFSQLNERSCILAESIAASNRKERVRALYIFCNVDEEKADDFDTLKRRACALGAVLLARNEMELPFWKNGKAGREDLYFEIGMDEDRNLQNAIHLIEKAEKKLAVSEQERVGIYVFSNKKEAEIVLDTVEKGEMRVRLMDPEESAIYQLLFRYPLYRNLPEGAKAVKVLIAGCGRTGTEALKAVLWCGQLHSLGLEVYVADSRAGQVEKRIRHDCPELLDSGCQIEFISCDVFGSAFDELLQGRLSDVTYCILSLGGDEENICTAIDLWRTCRYLHMDYVPTIAVHVRGKKTPHAVRTLSEKSNVQENTYLGYGLIPFGCEAEFYNSDLLGTTGYEALALNIHLQYSSDKNGVLYGEDPEKAKKDAIHAYYSRQSNIRSSRANALHIRYKLWELGYELTEEKPEGTKGKEAFQDFQELAGQEETMEWLADTEHRRWAVFYYTEGWRRSSLEQYRKYCGCFKGYDPLSRSHPCLVPTEELDQLGEDISRIFGEETGKTYHPDYVESDKKLIRFIPRILQDYWQVTGQKYWIVKRQS